MTNTFMTFQEVCEFFGFSHSTLRRVLARRKLNNSTFPVPLTGWGKKAIWRREEIENWKETTDGEQHASKKSETA